MYFYFIEGQRRVYLTLRMLIVKYYHKLYSIHKATGVVFFVNKKVWSKSCNKKGSGQKKMLSLQVR